ncbi:MAG: MazG-like family protein [Desulfitobacterium hafniense]|nr:MazG-like family protein [Desulfitobacterium hafniense]
MEHVEVDVVKGLRAIEELKVEMLEANWRFQHGILNGSEADILEGLAELVGLSYLVTRRLGYDFSRLDRTLLQKLENWKDSEKTNLEEHWGDLSLLLSYLAPELE